MSAQQLPQYVRDADMSHDDSDGGARASSPPLQLSRLQQQQQPTWRRVRACVQHVTTTMQSSSSSSSCELHPGALVAYEFLDSEEHWHWSLGRVQSAAAAATVPHSVDGDDKAHCVLLQEWCCADGDNDGVVDALRREEARKQAAMADMQATIIALRAELGALRTQNESDLHDARTRRTRSCSVVAALQPDTLRALLVDGAAADTCVPLRRVLEAVWYTLQPPSQLHNNNNNSSSGDEQPLQQQHYAAEWPVVRRTLLHHTTSFLRDLQRYDVLASMTERQHAWLRRCYAEDEALSTHAVQSVCDDCKSGKTMSSNSSSSSAAAAAATLRVLHDWFTTQLRAFRTWQSCVSMQQHADKLQHRLTRHVHQLKELVRRLEHVREQLRYYATRDASAPHDDKDGNNMDGNGDDVHTTSAHTNIQCRTFTPAPGVLRRVLRSSVVMQLRHVSSNSDVVVLAEDELAELHARALLHRPQLYKTVEYLLRTQPVVARDDDGDNNNKDDKTPLQQPHSGDATASKPWHGQSPSSSSPLRPQHTNSNDDEKDDKDGGSSRSNSLPRTDTMVAATTDGQPHTQRALDDLHAQLARQRAQLADQQLLVEALTEERDELLQELTAMTETAAAAATATGSTAKDEATAAAAPSEHSHDVVDTPRHVSSDNVSELAAMHDKLTAQQEELQQLRDALGEAEARLDEADAQHRDALARKDGDVDALHDKLTAQQEELQQLRDALAENAAAADAFAFASPDNVHDSRTTARDGAPVEMLCSAPPSSSPRAPLWQRCLSAEEEVARLRIYCVMMDAACVLQRAASALRDEATEDVTGRLLRELNVTSSEATDTLDKLEECVALVRAAREGEAVALRRLIACEGELADVQRLGDALRHTHDECVATHAHELRAAQRAHEQTRAALAQRDGEVAALEQQVRLLADECAALRAQLQAPRALSPITSQDDSRVSKGEHNNSSNSSNSSRESSSSRRRRARSHEQQSRAAAAAEAEAEAGKAHDEANDSRAAAHVQQQQHDVDNNDDDNSAGVPDECRDTTATPTLTRAEARAALAHLREHYERVKREKEAMELELYERARVHEATVAALRRQLDAVTAVLHSRARDEAASRSHAESIMRQLSLLRHAENTDSDNDDEDDEVDNDDGVGGRGRGSRVVDRDAVYAAYATR